jgi:two-component system, OmpR family, alkaline phosphatase synthesis response regulator PhoP
MIGKKILVVDDEIHIVHVVSIKLRNKGYDVVSTDNGADAYDMVCKDKPDLVITDLQMPVLNGLELVEKLRSGPDTKTIPVIMLTARSHAVTSEQQQQLGIHLCLSKPFSPRELLVHVEEALFHTDPSSPAITESSECL